MNKYLSVTSLTGEAVFYFLLGGLAKGALMMAVGHQGGGER